MGIPCLGLNGGPALKHCEAFSFQVATENQEETDRFCFFLAEDGIRDAPVTGVQTCALPISLPFRIARELRRSRPDVVLTQSPFEAAAALAARRVAGSRTRVVVELHGDWRTATRLYGSRLRRLLEPLTVPVARAALRRADVVRTISGYTTELIRPLGREPAAVFPAYVDLSAFLERPPAPLPDGPVVLFVGVLERYKGVDVLADAWPEVAARVEGSVLRIVGDGPEAATIERLGVRWDRRLRSEEV